MLDDDKKKPLVSLFCDKPSENDPEFCVDVLLVLIGKKTKLIKPK